MPAPVLDRSHLPPIKGMMKNYDSYLNQGISWNEFEVVARNCPHTVRFENRALRNKVRDFLMQARHNTSICVLDTEQILDYTYMEDDMAHMDEFRVKRNNERFGFSVENPSDEVYHEHAFH
jgi:hypothetical protein